MNIRKVKNEGAPRFNLDAPLIIGYCPFRTVPKALSHVCWMANC